MSLTRRLTTIVFAAVTAILITSCGPSYDDRVQYLRETSLRGVEINSLLRGQGKEVNRESCTNANQALNDDVPDDRGTVDRYRSDAWQRLVEETFVSACITGKF